MKTYVLRNTFDTCVISFNVLRLEHILKVIENIDEKNSKPADQSIAHDNGAATVVCYIIILLQ